jgi:hypothetical protein
MEIARKQGVPFFRRHVEERSDQYPCGVVDPDVDTTPFAFQARSKRLDLGAIADVSFDHDRTASVLSNAGLGDGGVFFIRKMEARDVRSRASEGDRRRLSNSSGAARYHRSFSGETDHSIVLQ